MASTKVVKLIKILILSVIIVTNIAQVHQEDTVK